MKEINTMSIDSALISLGLDDLPWQHAYSEIADLVNNSKVSMYFDEMVRGAIFNDDGSVLSSVHLGQKEATDVYANEWDEAKEFLVTQYRHDNNPYFSTNSLSTAPVDKIISASLVYFDKDEIEAFAKSFNPKNLKGDINLLKALALLAREKADKSKSFQSGGKVNASAFKNHIIDLVGKYNEEQDDEEEKAADKSKRMLTDGGLKGLDDKISRALDYFDLKDL